MFDCEDDEWNPEAASSNCWLRGASSSYHHPARQEHCEIPMDVVMHQRGLCPLPMNVWIQWRYVMVRHSFMNNYVNEHTLVTSDF